MLNLSSFNYHLPKELIAQYPSKRRDGSRLMVIQDGEIKQAKFKKLADFLKKGDLLVLNDARVMPARLIGEKLDSGGKVELLLLKEDKDNFWEVLAKGSKRLTPGKKISFAESDLKAEVIEKKKEGCLILKFNSSSQVKKEIWRVGKIPLPPYIKRGVEKLDLERYQTVFAKSEGAVAAPTAGLHFTSSLLEELLKKKIDYTFLTLNVGWGTFSPIREEDLTHHRMEKEFFSVSKETAEKVNKAKREDRRLIAVGTTSVRVLETLANKDGEISPYRGWTNLFIYPGYKFKIVDGILTNFHLPRTSLLLLVCAYLGRERTLQAYRQAIEHKYRFYSYGDAMLLLK